MLTFKKLVKSLITWQFSLPSKFSIIFSRKYVFEDFLYNIFLFLLTGEKAELVNEAIYSKPSDLKSDVVASSNLMTSSAYNYVWSSSSLDNYSPPPPRPPSMRLKAYNEMTNHHHHYHHHHRDSGIHVPSIGSSEDVSAPPLPPRSSCKLHTCYFSGY